MADPVSHTSGTVHAAVTAPNAVMNAGFMALFPLTFLSNVFVDPETLPSALEAFVNVNPVSILTDAARGLMDGSPSSTDIGIVLAMPLTTAFAAWAFARERTAADA